MKRINVSLGKKSYEILICYNALDRLGRIIRGLDIGTDAIVITNPTIKRFFRKRIEASLISAGFNVNFKIVPDSEKAKSERQCIKLLNSISKIDGLGRRLFIIALGGGVIGDLAGFVASIYRRGIPYIQVPTTLLAQVDSAIGGKVAIDLKVAKNLAGSFYQPRLVFSDASLLMTLSKKDLIAGLAEVVKYGIIMSPGLFGFLEKDYKKILRFDKKSLQYIVYKCSLLKAGLVEKDELDDKGVRVRLNFGHTIGHAIEAASNYSSLYTHGEAVSLGMMAALFISKEMVLLKEKDYLRITALLQKIGLPTTIKGDSLKMREIGTAQEHDKKFIRGRNRFVLVTRIGNAIVRENIPKGLVKKSIVALFK